MNHIENDDIPAMLVYQRVPRHVHGLTNPLICSFPSGFVIITTFAMRFNIIKRSKIGFCLLFFRVGGGGGWKLFPNFAKKKKSQSLENRSVQGPCPYISSQNHGSQKWVYLQ